MNNSLVELLIKDLTRINLVEKKMETMDNLEDILVWEANALEAIGKKKKEYYKNLSGITDLAKKIVEGYLLEDLKEYQKIIIKFVKIIIVTTFQNKLKDHDSKFILETEIEMDNDLVQIVKDERMVEIILSLLRNIKSYKPYITIMSNYSFNILDYQNELVNMFLDMAPIMWKNLSKLDLNFNGEDGYDLLCEQMANYLRENGLKLV